MSRDEQQRLLKAGDELFDVLERETLACLNNLETMTAKQIERFVVRRSELLEEMHRFEAAMAHTFDHPAGSGEDPEVESCRQRWSVSLRHVIEADGLVLALAKRETNLIKSRLAGIARGRHALRGYGTDGDNTVPFIKRVC